MREDSFQLAGLHFSKIVCRQRWVDRRGVNIGTEVNGISGRVLNEASCNMVVSNSIIGDRRIGRLQLHAARTHVGLFSPQVQT